MGHVDKLPSADADPAVGQHAEAAALGGARAAVLAEVAALDPANRSGIAPSLRPLSLNTTQSLYPPAPAVAAKVEARLQAGYDPEGHDYPRSRVWSRVVVPAIAVAALDVPVMIGAGIVALFHVDLAAPIFFAAVAVFVVSGLVALFAARPALRDPLRLRTRERRQLNQTRNWQSNQSWMGPRSSTPEYRLTCVAHSIVARLAASPAWGSRYLDEHRVRLNLARELDGIDQQAYQLAVLHESHATATDDAWNALVDRVARLRHYADRVSALDDHVVALDTAARMAGLDARAGQVAAGAALDEFAAEHVRALSADLVKLALVELPDRKPVTSSVTSPENAT